MCCHSTRLRHSCSKKISFVRAKVAEAVEKTFTFSGTYVYREPLCVLQVAEYLVRRQSNAFVHGMSTCAAVKSNKFRHGRQ